MPSFTATAPGKVILFGEHAVVHGRPAIAAPVFSLQARAVVQPWLDGKQGQVWIEAPDISLSTPLEELNPDHPLAAALGAVQDELGLSALPAIRIRISSRIPPASGLGSSAAVAAALVRAVGGFLGQPLTDEQTSQLTYQAEIRQHGQPSGIDNTVVAHQKLVFFRPGEEPQFLANPTPFTLLAADSGLAGSTHQAVARVRAGSQSEPERFSRIFDTMEEICLQAAARIESGSPAGLGELLNQNHALLQQLDVSHPILDSLVQAAVAAGADGAKLSGGGLGGHIIILPGDDPAAIEKALHQAGAVSVFSIQI